MPAKPHTVDEYIAGVPETAKQVVKDIRRTVINATPELEESISYGMPTYKIEGRTLFYVAAWRNHVSLHAIPPLENPLEKEVGPYRSGKDTVRFPLEDPIPYQLIEQITKALTSH